MNRIFASLTLFCAISAVVFQSASAVTIDWVPVGNPGNPAVNTIMNDGTSGYGAVAYNYNIDKYDVTVGQYTAFLNSVAATDTYGLYDPSMATNLNIAGVSRSGSSGSYSYSVIGSSANLPITYVSWGDAARFANWLQNGQPTGAEGPGTTETGAYTLNGATSRRRVERDHAQRRRDDLSSQRRRVVQGGVLRPNAQQRRGRVLSVSVFQQHRPGFGDAGQHARRGERPEPKCRVRRDGLHELQQHPELFDRCGHLHRIGQPLRRVRYGGRRVAVERGLDRRFVSGLCGAVRGADPRSPWHPRSGAPFF